MWDTKTGKRFIHFLALKVYIIVISKAPQLFPDHSFASSCELLSDFLFFFLNPKSPGHEFI